MEKEITLTTPTGKTARISAELVLSRTVQTDGYEIELPCCDLRITARIAGFPEQDGLHIYPSPVEQSGYKFFGQIGKLGLTAEMLDKVNTMLDEIKSYPAWVEKENKIRKNKDDNYRMESERKSHSGWCDKCGSYYCDCHAH